MLSKLFLVCLLFLSVSSQECYGLALEGGGAKGAYEAGVLFAFANATSGPFIKYNIATGISIGAMNCALISQFSVGDELSMSKYMVDFWSSIQGNSDLFVEWKGGLIDGLLFQKGLYNNAPAIELGKKWMQTASRRNITVGATNMDLGELGNFSEDLGYALLDGITASASMPFFFPPHDFEGYVWSDGGVINNLDVASAVARCLLVTGDQSKITIDMIYDGTIDPLPGETSLKTIEVFQRVYAISSHDKAIWYTFNAQAAFPEVKYRYTVMPTRPMPATLNFTRESISFSLQLGILDGNNAIKQEGSGREIVKGLYDTMRSAVIYP